MRDYTPFSKVRKMLKLKESVLLEILNQLDIYPVYQDVDGCRTSYLSKWHIESIRQFLGEHTIIKSSDLFGY
jgi:hypothetical protein